MIVVDASALAKYILKEPRWNIIEDYLRKDEIYTVDHAVKEVLNAIWKNMILYKSISRDVALEKYDLLMKMFMDRVVIVEPEVKFLEKAFNIAINHSITIYDSLYIAQAMERRARLLTNDVKQGDVASRLGVETIYIK